MRGMQIHWALEILNLAIRFAATQRMQTWGIKEIIIVVYLEFCRGRALRTHFLLGLVAWLENCTEQKLRLKLIIRDLLLWQLSKKVPKKINWKCSTQRKLPILELALFMLFFVTLHKLKSLFCFQFDRKAISINLNSYWPARRPPRRISHIHLPKTPIFHVLFSLLAPPSPSINESSTAARSDRNKSNTRPASFIMFKSPTAEGSQPLRANIATATTKDIASQQQNTTRLGPKRQEQCSADKSIILTWPRTQLFGAACLGLLRWQAAFCCSSHNSHSRKSTSPSQRLQILFYFLPLAWTKAITSTPSMAKWQAVG